MRTHTSQFKDEIKQYGRQFNDTIYYNNTTYDGEHIFSVNYSVDTTLCKSVMQTLTIDTDISMNVGDTLDYGISVEGATDEIRFNGFIVNKIEEQKDKKSNLVTCYDNMIKSMKDYETPKVNNVAITFPITIRDYLIAICGQLGLTFKNASDTFTNYDKNITSEHYVDTDGNSLGYTFRDVLDDIAEAVGSFICIDNNGQLEIKGFTNTQDTINEDYFSDKNVNIGKKIGPYNVVVLSRANDSDNIHYPATLPSNPIEFKISDNAILEQDNREDFIQGIYNKINGLEFYLNDFATTGILYYEIGDKYNVSIDNTTYTCLMLSDNIKRTSGLKENILTKEPKQSVTDFKYSSSSDKVEITSKNAKILVDKANASINQIVSAVGDNGQVTSASIIQSINNDTSSIKLEADKIDINGVVSANNNFKIKTDGSVEINNGTIDLIDGGLSETIPELKITGRDGVVTNDIYSYGMYIKEDYGNGNSKEVDTDKSGYYSKQTHSDGSYEVATIDDYGVFYVAYYDTNGNLTRTATLFPGTDYDSAFKLGYGSDTNFEVYNALNNCFMKIRGSIVATDNNGNDKFVVDGSTGNTTINGNTTMNKSSTINSDGSIGLYVNGLGNEASIKYTKNGGQNAFVVGYGTAGFDGFGIYAWDTGKNVLTLDNNGNAKINGFVSKNLGGYLSNPMAWRILEIPRQFNGTIYITSENYGGVMQNCILQVSNAYGRVSILALSKQTYSSQAFSSARLVYALGNVAYLELITERTLNQIDLQITMIHSQNEGEYQFLNEIGSVPSGWSETTISLQI